MTSYDYEIRCA